MNQVKIHAERLRASGLRPTEQRIAICELLFDRKETFHFTIEKLQKIAKKNINKKISLATLYNTVHAFIKNGYIKEISLKGKKTFYDTNTENHHHFYDEDTFQLIDIKKESLSLENFPTAPKGKRIKDIEVTIRIANNYQKQKKL
tara:strand:- start:20977 stop:21411 length:435 start_codon:yes stop_codon:yes gene_type:complete